MSRIFEALQKIQSQQTPVVSGAEKIPPEPVAFWTEQREEELRPTSSFAPSEPPPRPSLTSFAPGLNTLRQRCAKPAWKLHKDSLVQSGSGENLFFIPAGRPVSNPTELLGSTRAKSLFERLNTLFDWVIVDTSPVLPVSDAAVLAPMCDGVIVVVGAGRTSSDLARTACQELRESRLLGVVLNGVEDDALGSPYAYYGRSEHLRS